MANITRQDLLDSVYKYLRQEGSTLKHCDVEKCALAVFDEIKRHLAQEDSVELRGFGTFCLKKRAAKSNARNLYTGDVCYAPEHNVVVFRPGKELKKMLIPPGMKEKTGEE